MRTKAVAAAVLCLVLTACASGQTKAQKSQAKDPRYQYNVGLFYLNQNDVDTAVAYFVRALTLDTRYYAAWNALGLAHSMKGRLEEAAKAYQKCLEVNPQFTEAHNNLGTVYQEMNRLDLAEQEFQKVLADPNYQSRELAYFNLARLYIVENKLELALDNVQKSIQIKPRLAMAHNLRGVILEKGENFGEAVASYETAVKIVPDDLTFNYNLAVACFKNKDYARAKEIFLKIQGKITDAGTKETIAKYLKMINDLG